MAAAVMVLNDKMDTIATVAQDYYDSDNAFNFYRQVNQINSLTLPLYGHIGYCCMVMVVVVVVVMMAVVVVVVKSVDDDDVRCCHTTVRDTN